MTNTTDDPTGGVLPEPGDAGQIKAGDVAPRVDLLATISEVERTTGLYLKVLLAGLTTGIAFNLLVGDAAGVGLNVFICMLVFFAGWFVVSLERAVPVWRKFCAVAALCYGLALAVRGSEILFTVNMVLAAGFTGMACTAGYGRRMRSVWGALADLLQLMFGCLLGFILLMTEVPWRKLRRRRDTASVAGRVLLGILISIPFLLVFGMLFSRAEVRFGELFEMIFSRFFETIFSHFWLTFWVSVFALGLLRNAFLSVSVAEDRGDHTTKGIGIVESATALVMLNALFFVFVITQIPYLFGGQDQVSSTPNLAWSEYARRGFFELAWVAVLLIPTLLLFMNFTRLNTLKQRNLLYGLGFGLTALAGIIIISALQRMLLYTQNYGLTELRVCVSTFIVMLAVILILLNVFTVMGRNHLFLPASLCVGFLFSVGIQVPNIQGMVAKDIINRHLAGKAGDMEYLGNLSTDAVPAIVESGLKREEIEKAVGQILNRAGVLREKAAVHLLYFPWSDLKALDVALENKIVHVEKDEPQR